MNTTPQKDLSSTPFNDFLLITLGYYIPEKEHMEADIKSLDLGNLEYGYFGTWISKTWNLEQGTFQKVRLGKFGIWRNHRLKDPRIVHKLAWEIWSVKGI